MEENKKINFSLKRRIILCAILGVLIISVFFLGYFTYYWTMPENVKTAAWVIKMIDNNYVYYDEETGEYREFTPEDYAKAITDGLLDRFSTYYSKSGYKEYKESSEGKTTGIGVYLKGDSKDDAIINEVLENSPAKKAGLKKYHKVVKIEYNGESYTIKTNEDFSNVLKDIETNEEFKLYVFGEDEPYIISREVFTASFVNYRDNEKGYDFVSNGLDTPRLTEVSDNISTLSSDTAYIKLCSFTGNAEEEFKQAYQKVIDNNKSKLILDLRDNGGGYMNILEGIAGYLIKDGTSNKALVAYGLNKKDKRENFYANTKNYHDLKIVVIANENTASASECLIGAMISYGTLDYDNLIISKNSVEEVAKTYGKGIMQTTYTNVKGEALKLTTEQIFWPNGETIHGKGVRTTESNGVLVSNEVSVDNELTRAIFVLD